MNALLIGRSDDLTWVLPQMLRRAGFYVDAVTSCALMKNCKFIRNCDAIPLNQSLLPAITQSMRREYDWIVITDDETVTEVLKSNLSVEDKLKLLPVQREENFVHLHSKIGLSQVFSAKGVNTPPFFVAKNPNEALFGANQLGYPVLIKFDSSGEGAGIFECSMPSDIRALKVQLFDKPILVQKKISGIEIDLSAVYWEENLIHFSYATPERTCRNKFGPSVLRNYHPLSTVDEQIFRELTHIGKVLGAHGITNISCIKSEGRRFYFEADMRPNVWIELTRCFGEDPSIRIQKWFSHKEKLSYPVPVLPNQPSQILIPYFLRLKRVELLFNRYNVWKFIPRDDWKLVVRLLLNHLFLFKIKHSLIAAAKRVIPQKYHTTLRKLKHRLNF